MPRNNVSDLAAHAASITNDDVFQKVISELKNEALMHLETDKLKAYGQDNLGRDRAVLEYQIVCAFEKKFKDYAKRK